MPARKGPQSANEIRKAQMAVEANMDDLKVHKTYIYSVGISNPQVIVQYKAWMKKFPKNVVIPLAIGTAYYNAEMPQAKKFLLKVVEMEPKNAEVWSMLSIDASRWGQINLSNEYMRKATLADTSNVSYAANYLLSLKDNSTGYKEKVFNFVKRFPLSERGAQALYWLGEDAGNICDKIFYFEELRKLYPPQKFNWSSSGMIGLADAYLQIDPQKALQLINEMGDGPDWKLRKQAVESLIQINSLEKNQNFSAALAEINQLKLPRFNYVNDFIILKKSYLLDKVGNVKGAYDSLIVKFAKLPTELLDTALESYGRKLGKDKLQIEQEVATMRKNTARPAYPFELGLYTSNGKLDLSDLNGKVVLLTFWFPGCGPCRAEFPHFQNIINKFPKENWVYLGINVYPEQDPYVLPFMKNTKYSFIPLRGNSAFAAKYYGVQGEPENFLIDKEGRIVFKDFSINNNNRRTLELMISSLLQKE